MAPNRILLARVWSAADKRNFIWAVSGPDVFPDHIARQADELVRRAEMMYDLSAQDDIWKGRRAS